MAKNQQNIEKPFLMFHCLCGATTQINDDGNRQACACGKTIKIPAPVDEYEEAFKKDRRCLTSMEVRFLAGTDIEKALFVMWRTAMAFNCDISGEFNGTRISMQDADFYKRFGDRKW